MKRQAKYMIKFIFIIIGVLGALHWIHLPKWEKTLPAPEVIIFQTGSNSIQSTILMLIIGSIGGIAAAPFFVLKLTKRKSLNSGSNKHDTSAIICIMRHTMDGLIALYLLLGGLLMIYGLSYVTPYSENIVIDKSTGSIRIERHYLLKNTTSSRIAFNNIKNVMYYEENTSITYGASQQSFVKLVTLDGKDIRVSNGLSRYGQYEIAKTISNVTSKRLVGFQLKSPISRISGAEIPDKRIK